MEGTWRGATLGFAFPPPRPSAVDEAVPRMEAMRLEERRREAPPPEDPSDAVGMIVDIAPERVVPKEYGRGGGSASLVDKMNSIFRYGTHHLLHIAPTSLFLTPSSPIPRSLSPSPISSLSYPSF